MTTSLTDPSVGEKSRSLFSDTILLAVIPSVAYGIAFTYEAGYIGAYGLPVWLVEVDISKIFIALGGLIGLYGFVNSLMSIVPTSARRLLGLLLSLLFSAAMWFYVWLVTTASPFRLQWALTGILSAVALWFTYLSVVHPLIHHRAEPNWIRRYELAWTDYARRRQENLWDVADRVVKKSGYDPLQLHSIVIGILLLLMLANCSGGLKAKNEDVYLSTGQDTSWIVIRAYHDHFIAARYHSASKTVGPQYTILSITEDQPRVWTLVRLPKVNRAKPSSFARPSSARAAPAVRKTDSRQIPDKRP
jgi:hypothetical protein